MEKVELLWQQAFSQARLQLQVFQLREDALQVGQLTTAFIPNLFGLLYKRNCSAFTRSVCFI